MATEALVWSTELAGIPLSNGKYEKDTLNKSNVTFSGNKLFYSNNPETLTTANNKKMLGSDGRWMARTATMTSNFRFYSWHDNQTSQPLKHWLTINNKGASALTVTLKRLKVGKKYCDAQDLADYLSGAGDTKTITVPGNGWNSFVLQENIGNGQVLSAICDIEFNGSAVFYDVAVPQNFSGGSLSLTSVADSQADGNTLYIRGVANSSVASILYPRTIAVSEFQNTTAKTMILDMLPSRINGSIVGQNDRFKDSPEVMNFVDPDNAGGYSGGCYATEYYFRIPIKNDTSTTKNIVMMLGSSYMYYGIVVNMNGAITPTKTQRPSTTFDCNTALSCREVINISNLTANQTHEIHFRMMVPGGSGAAARFYLKLV